MSKQCVLCATVKLSHKFSTDESYCLYLIWQPNKQNLFITDSGMGKFTFNCLLLLCRKVLCKHFPSSTNSTDQVLLILYSQCWFPDLLLAGLVYEEKLLKERYVRGESVFGSESSEVCGQFSLWKWVLGSRSSSCECSVLVEFSVLVIILECNCSESMGSEGV